MKGLRLSASYFIILLFYFYFYFYVVSLILEKKSRKTTFLSCWILVTDDIQIMQVLYGGLEIALYLLCL